MPAKNQRTKTNRVIVEDTDGVKHEAQVQRVFDREARLAHFSVYLACMPMGTSMAISNNHKGRIWDLPKITLGRWPSEQSLTVVKYGLHAAPTCVRCLATPKVFG